MSNKTAFPSDTADKVLVRMPDGMRDHLKAAAKANNRTMNAEIVVRLEQSFKELADSTDPMIGTSYARPLALGIFGEQIRLQLAISALESQARVSLSKLKKVQASITQIKAALAKAEAKEDGGKTRLMESSLSDEMKWLREVELEYTSTVEELAELKRALTAAQANGDNRFQLGA